MPSNKADSEGGNDRLLDRRTAIKAIGAGSVAAMLGVVPGSAAARTTVDLGAEGLSEGDTIDPYLNEYFTSGNEVLVPPGTYQWNGGGFPGTDIGDAALRGDGGMVKLDAGDGWTHTPDCYASSGTVLVENIQILGQVGGSSSDPSDRGRFSFGASSSSAKCVVRNFVMRDGSVADTWGQGIYIGSDHVGEVVFDGVDIRGMNNNGIYTGGSAKGPVHWKNCFFKNNNIANIRMATDGSSVKNCVVLVDAATDAPTNNMRGIWVREGGDNMTVDNSDVYYAYSGSGSGNPISVKPRDGSGSGQFGTVRVYNETDNSAIRHVGGDWSGNTAHVTGSGDRSAPSYFANVYTGSDATKARKSLDETNTGTGSDTNTEETQTDLPNSLTIEGTGYTEPVEYVFSVSEAVEKGPNGDSDDTINDTTVDGVVGGTDDFNFAGEVTAFDMSGSGTVYINGEQVDPSTLGSSGDSGSTDSGSTGDGSTSDGSTSDGSTSDDSTSDSSTTDSSTTDSSTSDGSTSDGSTDSDSTTDSTTTDSSSTDSSTAELGKTLTIDGTQSQGIAGYSASVSGDIARDEEQSTIKEGGSPWDTIEDDVAGSEAVGMVGYGKDVYRFSGQLENIDLRGEAVVTLDYDN